MAIQPMSDVSPAPGISPTPPLTAVVAVTPSGVIGADGDMPWRLRSDLQRFKKLTMGGVLIMGRRTYESIGRPLPGRRTIVVTRNREWNAAGVDSAGSPAEAVEMAGQTPAFVVGGAQIYHSLLNQCQQIYLTTVWSNVPGDTILELDLADFVVSWQMRRPATRTDDVPTEFFHLVRRNPGKMIDRPH